MRSLVQFLVAQKEKGEGDGRRGKQEHRDTMSPSPQQQIHGRIFGKGHGASVSIRLVPTPSLPLPPCSLHWPSDPRPSEPLLRAFVAAVAAGLVEGPTCTAAGPWHVLMLLKKMPALPSQLLEKVCLTACEVSLYLNFICNPVASRQAQTCTDGLSHQKSKNNKKLAIPSLPFSLGRCAAAHFGRRTVCIPMLHPLPSCAFTLPTLCLAGG